MAILPGVMSGKTYAAWPVWSGSTQQEVQFQPMPKKAATRLWHRARAFDRQTRREGCHGGVVGHGAMLVLHALVFDFLNFRTGRLDPSYAAIARAANVCERTVASALRRLKELRILNWERRCKPSRRDNGQFELRQESNAYGLLPSTQWRGYVDPPEAPRPPTGSQVYSVSIMLFYYVVSLSASFETRRTPAQPQNPFRLADCA
jgi:hypothetical protein